MVRVKFKGREMAHQDLGYEVVRKILQTLGNKIVIERPAKFEGRSITLILGKNKEFNKPQQQASREG